MSKDLHKILVGFAEYFASQEDNGEWWGYDTNLGKQDRQFKTTERMIRKWALEQAPPIKRPQDETGTAQAHQAVGYTSAIEDYKANLVTPPQEVQE